VALNSIDWI